VSLAAQLSLAPILAYYFNTLSLVNAPSNLFMIPITGFVLPAGLVGGIINLIIPPLGEFILSLLYFPLKISIVLITLLGKIPWAAISLPSPDLPFFILYYSIALCLGLNITFLRKHRKIILSLLLLAASILTIARALNRKKEHRIVIFNTSRSAVILVEKQGENILVLRKRKSRQGSFNDEISWKVIPYLKKRGISRLEALALSGEKGATFPAVEGILGEIRIARLFIYPGKVPENEMKRLGGESLREGVEFFKVVDNYTIMTPDNSLKLKEDSTDEPYIFSYIWNGGRMILVNPDFSDFSNAHTQFQSHENHILLFDHFPQVAHMNGKMIRRPNDDSACVVLFDKKNKRKSASGKKNISPIQKVTIKCIFPLEEGPLIFDISRDVTIHRRGY